MNAGSHSILQVVGLIGTDLAAPLSQAKAALKEVKPADASSAAQTVIDAVNRSSDQGMIRVGAAVGLLLVVLLLVLLLLFVRMRRRRGVTVIAPDGALLAVAVGAPLEIEATTSASAEADPPPAGTDPTDAPPPAAPS